MMCESKMISKNNDEVDVGCGNAFGGEGVEEAGKSIILLNCKMRKLCQKFSCMITRVLPPIRIIGPIEIVYLDF